MTEPTRTELPTGAIEYRDGGPAYIVPNNFEAWYQNGELHRDDAPAVSDVMGCTEWYHHGFRRLDLEREAANKDD